MLKTSSNISRLKMMYVELSDRDSKLEAESKALWTVLDKLNELKAYVNNLNEKNNYASLSDILNKVENICSTPQDMGCSRSNNATK